MCARYISDTNKVLGIHESGTYANKMNAGSTFWIGQVISLSIDDNENKIINRYLGTSSRNFGEIDQGPIDVTGTLTYHPQDMRIPFWAIGSGADGTAGSKVNHLVVETDTDSWLSPFTSGTGRLQAPISFTIEDSKQSPGTGANFIRTINGCVPNVTTIKATQGEKVSVDVNFIGQSLTHSSGATTDITEQTNRPYLWSDCKLTISGNVIETAKEISFEVNNNIEAPHYINGSRVIAAPFPGARDYALSVTADLSAPLADTLYTSLYKSNGTFNTTFDLDADVTAGSQHTIIFMSGCKIMSMDVPSTTEGASEFTIEIKPEIVIGSAFDRVLYKPF